MPPFTALVLASLSRFFCSAAKAYGSVVTAAVSVVKATPRNSFPWHVGQVSMACFVALATQVTTGWATDGTPRPNIVFVMADDLGYTDLGVMGSQFYETPNIDRLAAQGLVLTNHHHCQNCAPTRAAIMSGQYGARTGVYTVGGIDRFDWSMRPLRPVENVTRLPLNLELFPQKLREAGYATGMFGKWHLGQNAMYHPSARGFDEAIVSEGKHFNFETSPKTEYPQGQYLADFLTDRAIDFIDRHQSKPFFLYLPHFGVHSPWQAKQSWVERFKDKPASGGHHDATYAAMIASVDESVGRVMQKLDELKLSERTVFIFTSDNGGVGGYEREGLKGSHSITDNAPLRSGKGSLYEGGTRVPMIVRWPGVIAAGSRSHVPTIHVDVYPTMLELSGSKQPPQVLDGESLLPLFRDAGQPLAREAIYQHFPGYLGAGQNSWRTTPVSVIYQGPWKLMEFLEDGRRELYQLDHDLSESNNLIDSQADKANELIAKLNQWRQSVNAPIPTPNDSSTKTKKKKAKKTQ